MINENSTASLDHWLGFPLYNGPAVKRQDLELITNTK
jgi:hypothetical protein